MEIKPQTVTKMSKEQLYQLVLQKEISDADREIVKNELVKREAEVLYNQARRARAGEIMPIPAGGVATKGQKPPQGSGSGGRKILTLSPRVWLFIILITIVLGALVYAGILR